MEKRHIKSGFRQFGNLIYSIVLLFMLFTFTGCARKGNMTFNSPDKDELFTLSGKIILPEIVETDLMGSIRASLTTIDDFRKFNINAGDHSIAADKNGNFSLKEVPFSESMVIEAKAGKIVLLRRISAEELHFSDISNLEIGIKTTVEALVWREGLKLDKNLTTADIRAREYEGLINSIGTAVKLCLQLPPTSVSTTTLELGAIVDLAIRAANEIIEREEGIKDANSVISHAFLRSDLDILKVYISSSFSNDWDLSSNWRDFTEYYSDFFDKYIFTNMTWRIIDTEFLPENKARVRTEIRAIKKHIATEIIYDAEIWQCDTVWGLEGGFWKIYRNLPYRDTHPKQLGADSRWGEIADAHKEIQEAISGEKLNILQKRISESFGNDWDSTSTYNDLIVSAQTRFNAMDPKIVEYSIEAVEFVGTDVAKVKCNAKIRVFNMIAGIDIDSGIVSAIVTWKKEDGIWKIWRNLPYRFSHPIDIQ